MLTENLIDCHAPPRHSGLGFGNLAAVIGDRMIRILGFVYVNQFGQRIDVPNDARSGLR